VRGIRLAVAALGAFLLLAAPAGASNSQTFADSTGEDPAAPDITSIVVSNDDSGLVTFQTNVSNRPTLTQDMLFVIFLDTDSNPATGDSQAGGAEYLLQLVPGFVDLFKWNGSDYVAAPSQSSVVFSYASTGPTIKVSAADLGGIKAFNFTVAAVSGVSVDASGNPILTGAHFDSAPDPGHGAYAYKVLTAVKLSVVSFTTSPSPAKAGKAFTATIGATENDTSGPIKKGTVKCHATLGGRPFADEGQGVLNGLAICAWKLPKTARGKRFTGTVTVTVQGATVTRNFSVRVT
jgi:hypothetical protein